ncbi:hypothetical protein QKU48_gp1297 [Fadolivirus algeromassiliense]|jgi:hypothetical protein|uniref:Uncharacterized protein n=1 Tax=Fadolivirus FV1/VV64 TaxID=3070911 RepID=A0A7D3V606_9VIRU|nr:hypothetical protein QKU48_gp1297 [Fadolivirus algeromassiliense]QKF94755.1 hypothetical protein Fadolivirus_1_1297 [Fadolivirus FV1/VV64]
MSQMNMPLLVAGVVLGICCISYCISGIAAVSQKKEDNSNYMYGVPSLSSSCLSCIGCIALIALGVMGTGSITGAAGAASQKGGFIDLSTISSPSSS